MEILHCIEAKAFDRGAWDGVIPPTVEDRSTGSSPTLKFDDPNRALDYLDSLRKAVIRVSDLAAPVEDFIVLLNPISGKVESRFYETD